MDSKIFFTLFLFFSSWVFAGLSQVSPLGSMPCIQKLLPCQPYLKSSSSPPASCCIPLKEAVLDDAICLCKVFTNPEILKSMNITQDDSLKLSKACSANVDVSVCKKAATTPTGSPATPSTPSTNSSSSSNSTGSSNTKSAANGISHFGGAGFTGFFVALVISALWAS